MSLAIRRLYKAILGAFAVAGETHITLQAILGQAVQLILAELQLLGRGDHFKHVFLLDVSQMVIGFYKVIAGVEVAIVLDGQSLAAGLVEDTHAGLAHAQPVAQRGLEGLHVDPADVIVYPFVENGAKEAAELLGPDRTIGDGVAFLVEGAAVLVDALHHRDELHPVCADLIADEAVDFERIDPR